MNNSLVCSLIYSPYHFGKWLRLVDTDSTVLRLAFRQENHGEFSVQAYTRGQAFVLALFVAKLKLELKSVVGRFDDAERVLL
ncbi:MAG: hypothetical protein Q8K19_20325 [Methylicorpusculum sp.]|uniref:hypothetical protein n=1 Tax=Methylicorpusculum sp. TaxID=2713644 RepID=UPI002731BC74|nr:hypothetical protein [Methylicorpusculum sp.]MDP2180847.1 hypothetical protein [Methylicorpusculum sp.]